MSNTGEPKRRYLTVYDFIAIVSIFLILLAIIIPNFLKSSGRPKQEEARLNLISIYEMQKEYFQKFHVYASHSSDKNCFDLLLWRPDYVRPGLIGAILEQMSPKHFSVYRLQRIYHLLGSKPRSPNLYYYFCDTAEFSSPIPQRGCRPISPPPSVTITGFTVYAIGNIDNDPQCDVWSINDANILVNVENDV